MPVLMPDAVGMAFELATYGMVSGMLYKKLPKTNVSIYVSLVLAMVAGRTVWGAARFVIAGIQATAFPISAFLAGAVTNAIPGIVLHIILVPVLVMALKKTKLLLNE